MLKTSCISASEIPPSSWIRPKTGGDLERVRELVADVAGEAQEVVQAVAGDVGEAADVGVGGEQLQHRAHVDRRRLEHDVAERPAEAVVVPRHVGKNLAGERVAVRVKAGGGEADQGVAGARSARR